MLNRGMFDRSRVSTSNTLQHDTTLASVLTVLGVFDYVHTPYATVLMLELWETEQDGFVVRLLRHHGNEELVTYTLPGCGDGGCSLEQFHRFVTYFQLKIYFKYAFNVCLIQILTYLKILVI